MKYDALGYYQLLSVSPQAGDEQIKQSYRELAKVWHPDHNREEGALERFQKLSVAYDTLKEAASRLRYDLLSMVYGAQDYPEYENIAPFSDESGEADVRAFMLKSVRGQFLKYTSSSERKILSRHNAPKVLTRTALANWLLGWYHQKAFVKNIQALHHNYKHAYSLAETFRVLVHNVVAYEKQGDLPSAVTSAVIALEFADDAEKVYLEKFIAVAGIRVSRPQIWNLKFLQLVQLAFPASLVLVALLGWSSSLLINHQMKNWWGNSKEISYYQEVNTGYNNRTVDDVVVGKVHNLPINKSDKTHLYHLSRDAVVMYGPSDDFDVLKKVPAQTTVRLTGYSPDNIWARILIDNGEMGFVRMNVLIKGIGQEVPFGSAVYEN